jgi:hypothetical protein
MLSPEYRSGSFEMLHTDLPDFTTLLVQYSTINSHCSETLEFHANLKEVDFFRVFRSEFTAILSKNVCLRFCCKKRKNQNTHNYNFAIDSVWV